MAVVARPPVAAGSSGLKAALVTFVCLTVGSLGAFVYLFTLQADYEKKATDAEARATASEQKATDANNQLVEFARDVVGKSISSPADMQKEIDATRTALAKDERLKSSKIQTDTALLSAMDQLKTAYFNTLAQAADLAAQRDDLAKKLADQDKSAQTKEAAFRADMDKLQTDYKALEDKVAEARKSWTNDLAAQKTQQASANESAAANLNQQRQMVTNLETELTRRDANIQDLREKLASFRPSADQYAALQIADGTIVRLVPGQDIVYVGLGSRDRVKAGMNFSVYSRHRGIPTDGKGKATLEITQVFDTTSEAHLLSTTATDPVVEGDVVANPVYDRSRQFTFVVAGDFDLDFNGTIEDPGGQQVARMIESWGGKVVKTVDTRTDFVVLGAPPVKPLRSPTTQNAASGEHNAEYEAQTKAFDAIKAEARALSIPVLNRTQFLHFIGRPVPKGGRSDTGT